MSRYDDRYRGSDRRDDRGGGGGGYRGGGGGGRGADTGPDAGATRLYVGRLSTRTRSRDLEDLFAKYGRLVGSLTAWSSLVRGLWWHWWLKLAKVVGEADRRIVGVLPCMYEWPSLHVHS
nr:arginine/serine-rich splicing factor RS2Z37 transcript II [Physcomitrium patens]